MEKGFISRVLLITFILALAIFPLLIIFLPNQHKGKIATYQKEQLLVKMPDSSLLESLLTTTPRIFPSKTPSPTITQILLPTVIPTSIQAVKSKNSPIPLPTIISYIEASNSFNIQILYKSDSTIANSFSFSYPYDWTVTYQKEKDAVTQNPSTYVFNFLLQQNAKQNMTIAVFPATDTVQNFMAKTYPRYGVSAKLFGTIGNNPLYRMSSQTEEFGSRGVVLGKKHTYVVSFDSNSSHILIDAIEKNVWPTFKFE